MLAKYFLHSIVLKESIKLILSDSNKEVSKLYGVNTYFFPKRVTFLIDENGIVFDIIDNISLNDYAEHIIQIFKKNTETYSRNTKRRH